MKKFLHNKIIIGGIVLGTLVFGGMVITPVYAQSGLPGGGASGPGEILEKAGNLNGGPTINQLQFAPKNTQPASLGSSNIFGTSLQKVFRLMGQSIFDTVVAYRDTAVNMLYAGFSSVQNGGGSGLGTSSTPKLQVNGSITVKSLAQPGAPAKVQVCVNDAGILTRTCPPGGGLGGPGGKKG
tara:strand:+ start:968 stop:1513 length:546 start_codon:yes stop_codon:yes gene_type:complete